MQIGSHIVQADYNNCTPLVILCFSLDKFLPHGGGSGGDRGGGGSDGRVTVHALIPTVYRI